MAKTLISHSHDSVFKFLMQDKAIALEFVEYYLPIDIKAICDLSTLTIEPTSFVEPDLKQRFNDILYSINTQHGKGYIYCLIECQRSPDKFIAFRLIHYAIMAMENHIKQGHKKLPLVVPLLFYCGKKSHPKSIELNWYNLFDVPNMAKTIYCNPFKLIDVNQMDDNELKKHQRLGILEYLLKHIRTRNLMTMLNDIAEFLLLDLLSKEQKKAILIYTLNQGRIEESQIDSFFEQLEQKNLGDDTMITIGDYLRKQGRQEGIQRGSQSATITIARNLLKNGANIELVKNSTGLSEEEIKQLQK